MTENRGGKRENAGRKSTFGLSEQEMRRLLRALRAVGRENGGKSWQRMFAEHLYAGNAAEALPYFKLLTEKLFVAGSTSERSTGHRRPTIYLPEELPENVEAIRNPVKKTE